MSKTIAILEDEKDILELISINLVKSGYNVKKFFAPNDLFEYLKAEIPDLLILDVMLPEMDGFEVCKYLKKNDQYTSMPIIMLTARGEETDKVLGLELGADDYVTKPFSIKELIARVKAVLRRKDQKEKTKIIEMSDLIKIDLDKYEVYVKDKKVELTTTEFRILQLLISKPGWLFTRDKILDYLWGNEKVVLDRTIDVHIKNLRDKLGIVGKFIKNLRGLGYKFEI